MAKQRGKRNRFRILGKYQNLLKSNLPQATGQFLLSSPAGDSNPYYED